MPSPPQTLCGTVISAGLMQKAVKVRTTRQVYNAFLQKFHTRQKTHHVSDPNSSLRTGDVVRIAPAKWSSPSNSIKHVVTEIVAPWGEPMEERPPIPSLGELAKERRAKNKARMARKLARQKERWAAKETAHRSKRGIQMLLEGRK
ncbi:MAG: hypothetical protein Q9218_000120 [Villophora microphyllina]